MTLPATRHPPTHATVADGPAKLDADQLLAARRQTLSTPRMRYSRLACFSTVAYAGTAGLTRPRHPGCAFDHWRSFRAVAALLRSTEHAMQERRMKCVGEC